MSVIKKNVKISNAVIKRLPKYRRYLLELKKKGIEKISSKGLSEMTGYTASQIRQDLNNFGGFGQQGYGYSVSALYDEIGVILGMDRQYAMVIIGAGNLGRAIARYTYYYKTGLKVCGIFDACEHVIGKEMGELVVRDVKELEDFVRENRIDIGVICVPQGEAQPITDILCRAGIKGIWNFAPVDLKAKEGVAVENVHLSDSLQTLVYRMNER